MARRSPFQLANARGAVAFGGPPADPASIFVGGSKRVCPNCGHEGHDGCVPAVSPERAEEVREFVRFEKSIGRKL